MSKPLDPLLVSSLTTTSTHSSELKFTGVSRWQKTVTSAEDILKNKGDRTKFQNDATLSKFTSGNQPDKKVEDISKSSAEKHSLLPFSNEDSHKLVL